jgi:hypothetical protein
MPFFATGFFRRARWICPQAMAHEMDRSQIPAQVQAQILTQPWGEPWSSPLPLSIALTLFDVLTIILICFPAVKSPEHFLPKSSIEWFAVRQTKPSQLPPYRTWVITALFYNAGCGSASKLARHKFLRYMPHAHTTCWLRTFSRAIYFFFIRCDVGWRTHFRVDEDRSPRNANLCMQFWRGP